MRRLSGALLIFRWRAEVLYIYVASHAPCIDIHPFSAAMPVRMIATSGTDVPCSKDCDGLKGTGFQQVIHGHDITFGWERRGQSPFLDRVAGSAIRAGW